MAKQRLQRHALDKYDTVRTKYQNRYKDAFLSIMRMRARLEELDDEIHTAAQVTDNALANLPEDSNVSECKEMFDAAKKLKYRLYRNMIMKQPKIRDLHQLLSYCHLSHCAAAQNYNQIHFSLLLFLIGQGRQSRSLLGREPSVSLS